MNSCPKPRFDVLVQDADDTNPGMFYTGPWLPDDDPNSFGHHGKWTNQCGASVFFDFIGRQIEVLVTRRPVGTYLSNASFSIDGGPPDFWTTDNLVPAISYKDLIYTSLSPTQHRITVTHTGKVFWLDYMDYIFATTASPGGDPKTGGTSSTSSLSLNSESTIASTNPSLILRATEATLSSPRRARRGIPQSETPRRPVPGGIPLSRSTNHTSASSVASLTATSNLSSHAGMIAGIVVGVLGDVTLFLSAVWWLRMRAQAKVRTLQSLAATPSASTPAAMAESGMLPLPTTQYAPVIPPSELRPQSGPADSPARKELELFRAHEDSPYPVPYSELSASAERPSSALLRPGDMISFRRFPRNLSMSCLAEAQRAFPMYQRRHIPPAKQSTYAQDPSISRRMARTRAIALFHAVPRPGTLVHNVALRDVKHGLRLVCRYRTSATSGSSSHRSLYFRVLRRSRDGGMRIAGGRLGDRNAQTWIPAEFGDVLRVVSESSTMPPSYAQYSQSAASGE
ncbi:hypothetical protein BD414DRAFT_571887 [Trametes punicea]|nr:hypothetical protein BD414DRAFT_571887 [Trametes punicea]